ncbi:MAG TPA: hypothetical protein VMZ22_10320 [Acidimicrobiales bacterium]|nr:hypothetical protein [Acidimicrobiales bacterium]
MLTSATKSRWRESKYLPFAVVGFGAVLAGLLAVARVDQVGPLARPEFAQVTDLPLPAYPMALLGIGAVAMASRAWWFGLALFFAWLPFEDLVRKFANNDIRVYFVKDLLLLLALLGVAPRLRGCWRGPLGDLWLPTVGIFCIAVVYAVPAALIHPSIPIVGIHGRFLYAVLFPVGAYLAADRDRLQSALLWLAVPSALVCAVGIAQSIIGPEFLNPDLRASAFEHLTVTKVIGEADVVRPAGPFADVSRFASMTIVATTLAGCSLRLARSQFERRISIFALIAALAGAFASGSRTAILVAPPVAVLAALAMPPQVRRRVARTLVGTLAAVAIATVTFGGTALAQSLNRVTLYVATLNPGTSTFELGSRARVYATNAATGAQFGGFLGNGTGTEAIGKRYLGLEEDASQVESGWGAVGAEWGFLGLAAWVAWSILWTRRAFRAAQARTNETSVIAPVVAAYLASLLLVMFSLGSGFLDNYIANIFFWLLSGAAFASLVGPTRANPGSPILQ